jgi:type I restriction enzyme S subunit
MFKDNVDESVTFCGFIIRARPIKQDLTYPDYIVHYLRSPKARKELIQRASTTTITNINQSNLSEIVIPLPPLSEQQRIVEILDEALTGIATIKANTERNLQNARELFQSYLQSIFSNPSDDWEVCLLEKHIKFIDYRGKTPKKMDSGLRLITAKNVKQGFLQKTPEEFVNPEIYDSWMTRGIPKKGDVLFTTEAPLANVAQLDTDEKVVFAQRIIIMQPRLDKISQSFLKYLLLSQPIQTKILNKGTGATVQGIKSALLKKIEIYFPSLQEQQKIVEKLDALLAETKRLEENYQQKLNNLEELKKSILQKAFNGELTSE